MALEIPIDSITLMHVNTAPPGWVKTGFDNEHILRVTTGSIAPGGSVNFSSFAVSHTTTTSSITTSLGTTTLTTGQLPSHTHSYYSPGPSTRGNTTAPILSNVMNATNVPFTSTANGGAAAHGHPWAPTSGTFNPGGNLDMRVKYVDVLSVKRV